MNNVCSQDAAAAHVSTQEGSTDPQFNKKEFK